MAWAYRAGTIVVVGLFVSGCGLSEVGDASPIADTSGDAESGDAGGLGPDEGGAPGSRAPDGGADDGGEGNREDSAAPAREDSGPITEDASPDEDAGAMDAGPEAEAVDATSTDASASDASDAADASEAADALDAAEAPDTSGPPDAARPAPITVIQTGSSSTSSSGTLSIPFSPSRAGSFFVVMSTFASVTETISAVVDNAPGGTNTYVSANLRSAAGTCQATELWYARAARPGATSVTVTTATASTVLEAWVMEVAGLAPSGGVNASAVENNGPVTALITAPTVTPSAAPALVVAAVASCGSIGTIAAGSPFIALTEEVGNNAAYYVTPSNGAYGPVFNNQFDAWNASVAAFR
jgi:hypothetical protein